MKIKRQQQLASIPIRKGYARGMDMKAPVRVLFACGAAFVFSMVASLFLDVTHLSSSQASALTTVPTKMNFQGRLTDSSGLIVANGTYNMQFRLYSASSGGSLLWSEERLVNDTKGVTVTNGLFAIKLGEGDIIGASTGSTPLNPANFASGSVYLEVTMATPANATTNTASTSMVWESPMSPRSLMVSSAYAFNSETLDGLDSADFAQIAAANTFTNTNVVRVSNAAAFDVQNSSNTSVLKVDTTGSGGVTVLGGVSGSLGSWASGSTLTNGWTLTTVASGGGYVYVSGGMNGSSVKQSTVYYAKLNADGSIGTWQTSANTLPQILTDATSVVVNGYLYVLGGHDVSSNLIGSIYYSKIGAGGAPGAWQTASITPTAEASLVTANGYIFKLGGDDNPSGLLTDVVSWKVNADGSLGGGSLTTALPAALKFVGAAVVGNYLYAIGGDDGVGAQTTVYYSLIDWTNGTVGTWQTATALPVATSGEVVSVANGQIYVRQGTNMYYARPTSTGNITAWTTGSSGAATGHNNTAANGFLYQINSGTANYYSRAGGSLSVGGGIDLVSLQSSGSNTSGGFLMAGDVSAYGKLDVQGDANFTTNVSVLGDFNAGSGIFSTASSSNIVRIGQKTADATGVVLVLDTKNTSADPTSAAATNGAMYYNSSLGRFRCYESSSWRNCTGMNLAYNTTATQGPLTAGTDTYLTGSNITIPAYGLTGPSGGFSNGTLVTWRVYLSKTTAAGTAASTLTLRVGSAGTTADAARCNAFNTGTATAAIDGGVITVTAYATAGGTTTTLNCSFTLTHQLPSTGLANVPIVQDYSTAASFNTVTNPIMGLSFNAGTSSVITVQKVEVQVANL